MLSESSKSKLFEIFKGNPKSVDHRALAQKFKISIERVKAIIRQKELELELASQGKTIDKNFVDALESNLGCVEIAEEDADIKAHFKRLPFRPMFSCVPEGRNFSFEDAKSHLMSAGINIKVPNANRMSRESKNDSQESPRIISKSDFEKSRSKFIFVNVKKNGPQPAQTDIIVRDCDGTLRGPTSQEIDDASDKTWNRNSPKILK